MRSRGWGYSRQDWYSICSRHGDYDPTCDQCRCGKWEYRVKIWLSQKLFDLWPWAWMKLSNRKHSRSRKQLCKWFPNLR